MTRRRREPVETPEYAAMVRRMIRAHGRRVAEADPEDLADLVELEGAVEAAVKVAVRGLREQGHSWAAIARGLSMTRQSAWERFTQSGESVTRHIG